MTAGAEFRTKAILGLWRYRRGAAAFIANRTRIPFVQCRDIVEWNWHILVEAYDEGARFQEAGRRIMTAGDLLYTIDADRIARGETRFRAPSAGLAATGRG